MASGGETVPDEVTNDNINETASDDSVDSIEFPFIDGLTVMALLVQNTRLHVNKTIVMIASPVFRKMLSSVSKESEVVLENKEKAAVTLLMKCIYPDRHVTFSGKLCSVMSLFVVIIKTISGINFDKNVSFSHVFINEFSLHLLISFTIVLFAVVSF